MGTQLVQESIDQQVYIYKYIYIQHLVIDCTCYVNKCTFCLRQVATTHLLPTSYSR